MKRRSISFILCISMLLSMLIPKIPIVYADANSVFIRHEGVEISEIEIEREEKAVIEASTSGISVSRYQWQLLFGTDGTTWINVYDRTAQECEISYSLVKNVLSSSDCTYIRCRITSGEEELFSDPVLVTVVDSEEEKESIEEEKILLTDRIVLGVGETIASNSNAEKDFDIASDSDAEKDVDVASDSDADEDEDIVFDSEAARSTGKASDSDSTKRTVSTKRSSPIIAFFSKTKSLLTSSVNDDAPKNVKITIKYLDEASLEDGAEEAPLYNAYTAVIEKGSAFEQEVISPTFLGFAPYYDADGDGNIDDDASVIRLKYEEDELEEDITFNVYYKAVDVNYAIRFFFQNVHDDLYTENTSFYTTRIAKTGTEILDSDIADALSTVDPTGAATIGFEKLFHYPEKVAADGSTVFESYYDRNYYLIQFDLNGGYGVEPIYARYGSPFLVNNPVQPGYVFAGWELKKVDLDEDGTWDANLPADMNTGMVSTIPAYNCYYQAQWIAEDKVNATVVYWLEDPDIDGKYNYWGSRPLEIDFSTVKKLNGKNYTDYSSIQEKLDINEKKYSSLNETKTNVDVPVNGDGSTIVNVYYDRKEYELRFYYAAEERGSTSSVFKVVGGSTNYFGKLGSGSTDSGDAVTLLDYEYTQTAEWGEVTATEGTSTIPVLNSIGIGRLGTDIYNNYQKGSEQSKTNPNRYYHYIKFKAKYGADISELWPCGVFEKAYRTDMTEAEKAQKKIGTATYVSAWNGEHHVYYSQRNNNETVKGNYEKLDYNLLFDVGKGFVDSEIVSYLAFWENGANKGWSIPKLWIYNIWLPVLSGENVPGIQGIDSYIGNGITYKLAGRYLTCDNNDDIGSQTQVALEGFTSLAKEKGSDQQTNKIINSIKKTDANFNQDSYKATYTANFFYSRVTDNKILFYSNNSYVAENPSANANEGILVPYGTSLKEYFFTPEYPDTLEEYAYYFDGWYTSPEFVSGTEFFDKDGNFNGPTGSTCTMPSSNLTLYAKWTPVEHAVRFFTTYDKMVQYQTNPSNDLLHQVCEGIEHGTVITETVNKPSVTDEDSEMGLIFAGWFYMDNGEKKAFTPLDMPVNKDLYVFADWSSQSPQPYKIRYVLKGTDTKVAEDTTGFAYYGTTRTFIAKAGNPYNQLYVTGNKDYNSGYYPTVSSHSITVQAEDDKYNPVKNVFNFEYVDVDKVKYTVRYLNKITGLPVANEKVVETSNAVVTERFVAVTGMAPSSYYERLVLAVEWDEESQDWVSSESNVITFYYTENTTTTYYAVHYMFQTLESAKAGKGVSALDYNILYGSTDFVESEAHTEGTGTIGKEVSVTAPSFTGFTHITDSGDGKSPAIVYNSSKELKYVGSKYTMEISANGTELYIFYVRNQYRYETKYYKYNTTEEVSDTQTEQKGTAPYGDTITVSAPLFDGYTCVSEQEQTIKIRINESQNIATFYYSPTQYTVEYKIVTEGGSNGGSLSKTLEVKTGSAEFEGSIATANQFYEFSGWYLDELCTEPVVNDEHASVTGTTLVPIKSKLSAKKSNIFYAKFIRTTGDLVISRKNASENDQVFIYKVQNNENGELIYVTVLGNGSVTIHDLPLANYTVAQQNNWSWRYDDQTSTFDLTTLTNIEFNQKVKKHQWLDGNSQRVVNKGGE